MRPIANATNQGVLDRINVAILDMASVVGVVSDQMLPKTTLPDAAFAACLSYGARSLLLG